jgi:K+-transporting ATPase KdpF subunit
LPWEIFALSSILRLNKIFIRKSPFFALSLFVSLLCFEKGGANGSDIHWNYCRFFRSHIASGKACGNSEVRNRTNGDQEVTVVTLYWISGIIAVGLLIYLVIALMKPEIFS